MTGNPVRQADPAIGLLLATLDAGRAAMTQALCARPSDPKRQRDARRGLLVSLEAYSAGLGKRNFPVPPRLRDEISLQRALVEGTNA